MLRENHRPPEAQRDFPPNGPRSNVPWQLALLVGLYLLTMGAGVVLLVGATTPTGPNMAEAEILAGR